MSSGPLLSIIIVSYQTRTVLEACLRSVYELTGIAAEVILIDNASTDGSADMVAEEFPALKLIRNTENVGFSPANNQGMALATGRFILLLNPDTVVLPGSITQWVQLHEQKKAIISGPALIHANGKPQVSAWRVPDAMDSVLEACYLHRILKRGEYPVSKFQMDQEVGFVSGAALLFKRKVYERIGGLDPELFWMEDTDYCVRATSQGNGCFRFHEPTIIHIGGESTNKAPARMISNQLISRIKFARKYASIVAQLIVIAAVYFQVITRMILFGIIALFRPEPRAAAYRYTFGKLGRYLFKNDRSI